MNFQKSLPSLTGFQLKYIALITMFIDHLAATHVFIPYSSPLYTFCRFIGRISFPIFCFLLVEGFTHTSNRISYLIRLFLFALLSEVPFDLALFGFPVQADWNMVMSHQNVFFTLSFGFLAMYILEKYRFENQVWGYCAVVMLLLLAEQLHFDYGASGMLVMLIFYWIRRMSDDSPQLFRYMVAVLPVFAPDLIHLGVFLSPLILQMYNGDKGSPLPKGRTFPGAKHLFYAFYPVHLALLAFLKTIISG